MERRKARAKEDTLVREWILMRLHAHQAPNHPRKPYSRGLFIPVKVPSCPALPCAPTRSLLTRPLVMCACVGRKSYVSVQTARLLLLSPNAVSTGALCPRPPCPPHPPLSWSFRPSAVSRRSSLVYRSSSIQNTVISYCSKAFLYHPLAYEIVTLVLRLPFSRLP